MCEAGLGGYHMIHTKLAFEVYISISSFSFDILERIFAPVIVIYKMLGPEFLFTHSKEL